MLEMLTHMLLIAGPTPLGPPAPPSPATAHAVGQWSLVMLALVLLALAVLVVASVAVMIRRHIRRTAAARSKGPTNQMIDPWTEAGRRTSTPPPPPPPPSATNLEGDDLL